MQRRLSRLAPAALILALCGQAAAGPSWQNGAASFVETVVAAPETRPPDHGPWPVSLRLDLPSDAYRHDIMGGVPPWRRMQVRTLACATCRQGLQDHEVVLPPDLVFEDPAPRLWDVTGDGLPEIVVVETSLRRGARLAIWTIRADRGLVRLAATPFIGRPQRWLAPVAAGDLDGDGRIELAYVDRPHLRRQLVILRLTGPSLTEVARLDGLTAHRIGDTQITAALRTCGAAGAEILLPDATWQSLMAVRLGPAGATATELPGVGPDGIAAARRAECLGPPP